MAFLLVFSVTLLAAVYLSSLAKRSILSSAVLFLVVGIIAGDSVFGWISIPHGAGTLRTLANVTLFSILFTDGMQIDLRRSLAAWRLPVRALLIGLPLTLFATAILAHFVAGVAWVQALLLGAILSPTDPVLVSAIVGRESVPWNLRNLLNVESGFNDGLALPAVLLLIGALRPGSAGAAEVLLDLGGGIGLGLAVPWLALRLEKARFFEPAPESLGMLPVAVAMILFGVCSLVNANLFLAAFPGGMIIGQQRPEAGEAAHGFAEAVTKLLKLSALLLFGSLISVHALKQLPLGGYGFAVLALAAARPLALAVALAGAGLPWRQWVTAAWFGPKGFASVSYTVLALTMLGARENTLYQLAALVITLSIVAHSSTDVAMAHWLRRSEESRGPTASASGITKQ